ncbi:MAG: sulfotransferase domain-containing protein [Pseudomonadota bacterium]
MVDGKRRRAHSMQELAELQGSMFDRNLIEASIAGFRPQPGDVIIAPYGKSGTTWTQQIFHTLRTRGDMDFDDISRVVPWIEMSGLLGQDLDAPQKAPPRGFKSHLGYDHLPRGARYINVIRDPLDAAYSAYKFMEGWYLEPGKVSAEEFVLSRVENAAAYHKHFVSFWPHRNDEDVLYLVYEHMRMAPEQAIERIAGFVDIELDPQLRSIVLEHASLPFMQTHKDRFDDAMLRAESERVLPEGSDSAKVRAGKVGEFVWPAHVLEHFAHLWDEHVKPVTGFDDYASLIAALEGH